MSKPIVIRTGTRPWLQRLLPSKRTDVEQARQQRLAELTQQISAHAVDLLRATQPGESVRGQQLAAHHINELLAAFRELERLVPNHALLSLVSPQNRRDSYAFVYWLHQRPDNIHALIAAEEKQAVAMLATPIPGTNPWWLGTLGQAIQAEGAS